MVQDSDGDHLVEHASRDRKVEGIPDDGTSSPELVSSPSGSLCEVDAGDIGPSLTEGSGDLARAAAHVENASTADTPARQELPKPGIPKVDSAGTHLDERIRFVVAPRCSAKSGFVVHLAMFADERTPARAAHDRSPPGNQ